MPFLHTFVVIASWLYAAPQDLRAFDADRFRPAISREGILNVDSAVIPDHLTWDLSLWSTYSKNLLTLTERKSNGDVRRLASLLEQRAEVQLLAAMSFYDWFQLGIAMPVTVLQTRDHSARHDFQLGSIEQQGLQDLSLMFKLRIPLPARTLWHLAGMSSISGPIGYPKNAYQGDRSFMIDPQLLISRIYAPFTMNINVGARVRKHVQSEALGLSVGNEIFAKYGGSFCFGASTFVPTFLEFAADATLPLTSVGTNKKNIGLEALGSLGFLVLKQWRILMGGAFGLMSSYSVPDYRGFIAIQLFDRYDNLPIVVSDIGTKPLPDRIEIEEEENFQIDLGEEEYIEPTPDMGSPSVLPTEAPPPQVHKELAHIQGCTIQIDEKIYFDPLDAYIQRRSFRVLNSIVRLLKKHTEIRVLRIEGHTDDVGSSRRNMRLSKMRANSVKKYLIRRGIDEDRLRVKGFGERRPIGNNNTDDGRSQNRRVAFIIQDCSEK